MIGQPPRLNSIQFNTTKSCNLACSFCYDNSVRGKSEELPIQTIDALAEDAAALGCKRVILTGGEPLVRKDWRDVAGCFDDRSVEVALSTNGTLLTPSNLSFLKDLRHCVVQVSIDGDETTHDELRGRQGAFRKSIRGIEGLASLGIPFHLNTVLSRTNVENIGDLTKLARDFSCDVRLTLLQPNGKGSQLAGLELDIENILHIREYCKIVSRDLGINVFLNLPPLLQYVDDILPTRGAACGWASNFCGILANGDVTICGVASGETDLIAGNLKLDSFKNIWSNSTVFKTTRLLRTQDLKGICGRCPFREFCGGACRLSAYRVSSDFLAPNYLCEKFYSQGYIPTSLLN